MNRADEHVLGIDLGTTGCRATLFTASLQAVGESSREYPLVTGEQGEVEQDANLWWEIAKETVLDAVSGAEITPSSVRTVSVSSRGIAFVPVAKDGNALCSARCGHRQERGRSFPRHRVPDPAPP